MPRWQSSQRCWPRPHRRRLPPCCRRKFSQPAARFDRPVACCRTRRQQTKWPTNRGQLRQQARLFSSRLSLSFFHLYVVFQGMVQNLSTTLFFALYVFHSCLLCSYPSSGELGLAPLIGDRMTVLS